MILLTDLIFLAVILVSESRRQWQTYFETMLFVSFLNLLYNFLCSNYLIWSFQPDILSSHTMADLTNTIILLPCITLLYLNYFPDISMKRKVFYYVAWVVLLCLIEYTWLHFGKISYHHGWSFYWSIGFYFAMFFMIRFFHTHRAKALLLSSAIIVLLLFWFKIPVFQR